jgi:hypothetical protein
MDTEMALTFLKSYLAELKQARVIVDQRLGQFEFTRDPRYIALKDELAKKQSTLLAIAENMNPLFEARLRNRSNRVWDYANHEEPLTEMIGQLENEELTRSIVGPSGPTLRANQLHGWIWNAAQDLWSDGYFPEAVKNASSQIFDAHLPAKLGVPRSPKAHDLVSQAFSVLPPTSVNPRLRFQQFPEGSADWVSAQEGAGSLGRACASGIRNIVTHGSTSDEQLALEQLATLSLLSRWIDEADVLKSP